MNEEQMANALGVSLEGKKIKKVCSLCGSDDVVVDAYAQWDIDIQDFVLHSTYDNMFCNGCEKECDIMDEEIGESTDNPLNIKVDKND